MMFPRRSALVALAAVLTPALSPSRARGQADAPGLETRAAGRADARVTVEEWFSLTCSHCAAFQATTFPQVKAELIDSGRVRYVWRDFPLDRTALTAAMVARSLPPERYEPFISTLLATQDRWAFNRGADPVAELAKYAALAGMPRSRFDQVVADEALQKAILAAQDRAEKTLGVQSTPSFLFNGKLVAGAIAYPAFLQAVEAAQQA